MNLLDAAYNVVHDHPGGADALAPRVGKNPTTLCHEVSGTGTAKFGLLDAQKVTQRSGDLRILQVFAANCGQMLLPLPQINAEGGDDCMVRLADTAEEFSDLCREIAARLADGNVSANDMKAFGKESGELISSLHALHASLARRHAASQPATTLRAA